MNKSKNFTDSRAWQEGHRLVLATYRFLRSFPSEEQFSLRNQMQQSSVQMTTNIAEGISASDASERQKYFLQANACYIEYQNCILIARDVGYLKQAYFDEIARQMSIVSKVIDKLVKDAEGTV